MALLPRSLAGQAVALIALVALAVHRFGDRKRLRKKGFATDDRGGAALSGQVSGPVAAGVTEQSLATRWRSTWPAIEAVGLAR